MTTVFDRLWAESKVAHQAEGRATAHKFRRGFQKLSPRALLQSRARAERNKIRKAANGIVAEYAPQIIAALDMWEEGFNQWEAENGGPSRAGSASASRKEEEGSKSAGDLSSMMIGKLWCIRGYDRYFRLIESPARMAYNPYPGYISMDKARNYCEYLMQAFA